MEMNSLDYVETGFYPESTISSAEGSCTFGTFNLTYWTIK